MPQNAGNWCEFVALGKGSSMRAGIVAIFFFTALLALGHYVAAPFFCRGGLTIPTLDPRALCGADMHLNRSGSVLLYFASIAAALFFGIAAAMLRSRNKSAPKDPKEKTETNPAAAFEQIIASEEKKAEEKPAVTPAAHPSALPAQTEPAAPVAAPAPEPQIGPSQAAAAAAQSAIEAAIFSPLPPKPTPPAGPATQERAPDPATTAKAEAITVGLAVKKSAAHGAFDGTNDELMERFRELKKQEGVNSIAQAQRLLDESTMSALSKGVDPKSHLSQVAHLVLTEDPDLKSAVVRGVVVHVAARLKELGVAKPNIPGPAKGAA
jgi:hypothetical protein